MFVEGILGIFFSISEEYAEVTFSLNVINTLLVVAIRKVNILKIHNSSEIITLLSFYRRNINENISTLKLDKVTF